MESVYQVLRRSYVVLLLNSLIVFYSSLTYAEEVDYYSSSCRISLSPPSYEACYGTDLIDLGTRACESHGLVFGYVRYNYQGSIHHSARCTNGGDLLMTPRTLSCNEVLTNNQLINIQKALCEKPPKDTCNTAGNPCQVSTGAKFLNETDIASGSMTFTRNYHSLNLTDNGLGKGWHNPYFKGLTVSGDNLSLGSGTGREEPWGKIDGVWVGDADSDYLVAETGTSGFTVTDSHKNVSEYDSAGRLLSETDAQGRTQSYTYDVENRLISIANHYGVSLSFVYSADGKNHVTQVIETNGVVYRYEYDSNDNLIAVIYPDNTTDDSDNPRRIYHYENTDFPNHLTGITNVDGERYATYAYDSDGKAILTEHAQTTNGIGQERFQLSY